MRILAMIGVMIMLFGFNGCDFLRSRTALLNSDTKTEVEAIKEAETTIIEALNRKDKELLKSVFSEDALSKDPAIEEEIDYLFDLYEGDFIEVTYRNHSSSDHWGEPGNTKRILARCNIKTSKTIYELHYCLWAIQEQNPAKKGVYSIQLFEYEEKAAGYFSMAGVQTPERACVNRAIGIIYDSFVEGDEEKLKAEFSEQLLNTENLNKNVKEFIQLFGYMTFSDVKGIWTTDTSTQLQRQRHAFMEIDGLHDCDYILYFRYEDWENDKISIIKVTEIEEGKTEYDYDLGEELTEPGIYLP